MRKAIHEEGRKGRNFNYSSGRHRNGWCEMMEILVAVEAQVLHHLQVLEVEVVMVL